MRRANAWIWSGSSSGGGALCQDCREGGICILMGAMSLLGKENCWDRRH